MMGQSRRQCGSRRSTSARVMVSVTQPPHIYPDIVERALDHVAER